MKLIQNNNIYYYVLSEKDYLQVLNMHETLKDIEEGVNKFTDNNLSKAELWTLYKLKEYKKKIEIN